MNLRYFLAVIILVPVIIGAGCTNKSLSDTNQTLSNKADIAKIHIINYLSGYELDRTTPLNLLPYSSDNPNILDKLKENHLATLKTFVWGASTGQSPEMIAEIFQTDDASYNLIAEKFLLESIYLTEICRGSFDINANTTQHRSCQKVGELPNLMATKKILDENIKVYIGSARGLMQGQVAAYVWSKGDTGLVLAANSSLIAELDKVYKGLFTTSN